MLESCMPRLETVESVPSGILLCLSIITKILPGANQRGFCCHVGLHYMNCVYFTLLGVKYTIPAVRISIIAVSSVVSGVIPNGSSTITKKLITTGTSAFAMYAMLFCYVC